jgi:tRNA (adenine37-N6)-methyltransferase
MKSSFIFTKVQDQKLIDRDLVIIGHIRSPFKEKFGLPRQGQLAPHLGGIIELSPPYHREEWLRDLKGISHLWLITWMHKGHTRGDSSLVRPPRLGGNKKVSVFATRSPERPNPLGLTLVKLVSLELEAEIPHLKIQGHDLLDGTPILDLKPYLPEADLPQGDVSTGWIGEHEHLPLDVQWSDKALEQLKLMSGSRSIEAWIELIDELLRFDVRPRYKSDTKLVWMNVDELDFGLEINGGVSLVREIKLKT